MSETISAYSKRVSTLSERTDICPIFIYSPKTESITLARFALMTIVLRPVWPDAYGHL